MDITAQVSAISTSLHSISEQLNTLITEDSVTPTEYQTLEKDFIALEHAINLHSTIAAQTTILAERTNAAHSIGSTHLLDYLVETFQLSRKQAHNRITLAHTLYPPASEPPEPTDEEPDASAGTEPEDGPAPDAGAEPADQDELGDSGEPVDPGEPEKKTQQSKISAEKHAIITEELDRLNPQTRPSKQELLEQALRQAVWRKPEDLRAWLRQQVTKTNNSHPDPIAAMSKRYLSLSQPDANNMVRINGLIPAATAALITANTAPLTKRGDLVEALPSDDTRTRSQRYADALHHIMEVYNSGIVTPNRGGTASIIISMTTDDLDAMDTPGNESPLHTLYPTNTGYSLNLAEIMNLIAARYDFAVLLDGATGQPLNVGRTRRSATFEQKIALFASELVCTGNNCSRPALECQIHHLDPWVRGGLTNLSNLTQQCFNHHPRNDDSRTGTNGKGYMARDASTGKVGHFSADGSGPHFNKSAAAQQSGGEWARSKHRNRRAEAQPPPDDDFGLFERPAS